ncbi:hypothetical protein F8O01_02835 [Pseudoclavibacter chungangensis]|uniref:Endonuclease/exonuclease/phosphatase domain-containing protein n=1 Tax=Pseudoclavibacter chungangensis TaxID=587635 RepID=A0A7J5C050_9MICO|nr:hypothetical protein [Pseudoclavibacter chungangensis]KAB1660281.1 hypothetical protein F8O01_02835 [Pseudoclavibacter chungangensis]NYJ65629.1 hypothetical protein [Pseudoclavibacter chungangensis]
MTGEGGCHQLGAASQASFEVQRAKVHALLRGLADMDVIAVQGVANPLITPAAAGEYERLAQALTEHSGVQWGAVTAPEGVGGPWTNGFLYRTDRAEPQGQAVALADRAFERSSTPLVQAFAAEGREAVALVSVRLSTQSQSDYAGDREANRFAGTNEPERILQIETLARLVGEATIAQRTVLLGAFGSLTGDPVLAPLAQDGRIDAVEAAGLSTSRDGDGSGSVVHVYVPDGLSASGATTWPINSRSATTSGFAYQGSLSVASVDATSPERSAAEDPVLFSLSLAPQEQQTLNPVVAAQQSGPESAADPNATESASAVPTSTAPAATSGGTGNIGTAVAPSVSSGSSGQSQQDTSTEAQTQPAPSTNTTTVVAESSATPAPAAGPAKPDSQALTMPGGNQLANTGSNSPAAMGIAIAIVVAVALGAIITTIAGRARRT